MIDKLKKDIWRRVNYKKIEFYTTVAFQRVTGIELEIRIAQGWSEAKRHRLILRAKYPKDYVVTFKYDKMQIMI